MSNTDEAIKDTSFACGQLGYVIHKLPQVLETMRKAQALLESSSDFITASCTTDVKFAADELQFCIGVIKEAREIAQRDIDDRRLKGLINGSMA